MPDPSPAVSAPAVDPNQNPTVAGQLAVQHAPAWVLDTNVVMDWLVFGDSAGRQLGHLLQDGRARWLACTQMRMEFALVLARGLPARWRLNPDAALAQWDRLAVAASDPPPQGARDALRCRDRSDQVFLDLALDCGAQALLTHDRALLALARKARSRGLLIAPPRAVLAQWSQPA